MAERFGAYSRETGETRVAVEITIDGLMVKKVVEYTLNRISDAASIISFFISSGFEKKIKEEAERLENFIDERDEILGK